MSKIKIYGLRFSIVSFVAILISGFFSAAIAASPFAGVYTGTITSLDDCHTGGFGVLITEIDGVDTVRIMEYDSETEDAFIEDIPIASDGTFSGSEINGPGGVDIIGTATATDIAGTFFNNTTECNSFFSGTKAADTGPYIDSGGFFEGTGSGTYTVTAPGSETPTGNGEFDMAMFLIVAADGTGFALNNVVVTSGPFDGEEEPEGGVISVDRSGSISGTLLDAQTISGTFNAATLTASGTADKTFVDSVNGTIEWTATWSVLRTLPHFENDVLVDFGSLGLWARMNNSSWENLIDLDSEGMTVGDIDNNGIDDLVVDFGSGIGIFIWTNNSSWVGLIDLDPERMTVADIDDNDHDDLIVDFGAGIGIYSWMNNSSWVGLVGLDPEGMTVGDIDGNTHDDLVVDFGAGIGIYAWMNNSNWVGLIDLDPNGMTVGDIDNNGHDDLVVDFGAGIGLWVRKNNSSWEPLIDLDPDGMTVGDIDDNGHDDLVVDFGAGIGIYAWMNNGGFEPLIDLDPDGMTVGDLDSNGNDDLVVDFGSGIGLFAWMNNSSWQNLIGLDPDSMVTGNIDGK